MGLTRLFMRIDWGHVINVVVGVSQTVTVVNATVTKTTEAYQSPEGQQAREDVVEAFVNIKHAIIRCWRALRAFIELMWQAWRTTLHDVPKRVAHPQPS